MSSNFNLEVEAGSSVKLLTAGKYCDRDIVVSASGGDDSFYDTFWDAYQQNGNRTDYEGAFQEIGWSGNNFYPKYNLYGTSFNNAFRDMKGQFNFKQRLIECGVTFDTSQATIIDSIFRSSQIEEVPIIDFTSASRVYNSFNGSSCLHTIEKMIVKKDLSYTTPFNGCSGLVNIVFEGEIGNAISFSYSPLLSDASIQSIIDCLVDRTGQTAQTLTLHANVKAKLTDTQIATITQKNWTLA